MTREPMFNIEEAAPLRLAIALVVTHAVMSFAPAVRDLVYQWALLVPFDAPGAGLPRQVTSLPGHGFLHGGWAHVLVNSGMIVAFAVISMRGIRAREHSQGLARRASLKFWLVFLAGVITGGLVQWLWWGISGAVHTAALGASGGASALLATAGYAMGGQRQMIGFGTGWAVINVVLVVTAPILGSGIAWAAHMGGFLAGAFLAPHFVKAFGGGSSLTH
ncbi:MAG: rhomboid family intramembrane serine protease [Hyphomonadaceae bacterium]|nr:rhomboid family intramembrane serine protease [Hyphomonadaceae bacterium]MBC6412077.1 rhomboid family intramembrane serine protease [Hyphomonadaceae bacterium]